VNIGLLDRRRSRRPEQIALVLAGTLALRHARDLPRQYTLLTSDERHYQHSVASNSAVVQRHGYFGGIFSVSADNPLRSPSFGGRSGRRSACACANVRGDRERKRQRKRISGAGKNNRDCHGPGSLPPTSPKCPGFDRFRCRGGITDTGVTTARISSPTVSARGA